MKFLDWFIDEQMEEEANADEMVTKMRLFGSDAKALYDLDRNTPLAYTAFLLRWQTPGCRILFRQSPSRIAWFDAAFLCSGFRLPSGFRASAAPCNIFMYKWNGIDCSYA